MCLIFLLYGFWEFLGCTLNATSSVGVWKDSGMFETRGMSLFRAFIHLGSCANQVPDQTILEAADTFGPDF